MHHIKKLALRLISIEKHLRVMKYINIKCIISFMALALGLHTQLFAQTCTDPNAVVASGQTCSFGVTLVSSPSSLQVLSGGAVRNAPDANALTVQAGARSLIEISGSIAASGGDANGIVNDGLITSLTNSGSIQGGDYGLSNGIVNNGTITSLVNTSSIMGTQDGISNGSGAIISTLVNTGTISGGIYNGGGSNSIGSLNNLQGQAAGALLLTSDAPNAYNIIINSHSSYGQLQLRDYMYGSIAFNIYGNTGTLVDGLSASVVSAYTYLDVLKGFEGTLNSATSIITSSRTGSDNFFITGTSGSYFGYNYSLDAGTNFGNWNLILSVAPVAISTASTYQSSALYPVSSPVFNGGTLQVSSAGIIPNNFTVTANNGTINQNGYVSNFTGTIANSAPGVNGKLTIANSGSGGLVTLSGVNTYSGGTEVNVGANLSISSASNIGSGTLALVGSSTIPATLTTTASMTLNNPITVSGDPVFNVASGTTTTISSPITNGVTAGDVVVTGGGTLDLTAVNTYSGPTTVESGSTLALSGSGSITTSSIVTNNGTFNTTAKTGNVSVANYTQGSAGTLAMSVSPGNTQKLLVAGAASLAGGLTLTGSSGAYQSGRYALLTAGGVSGTFSALSSNLSSLTTLGYQLAYDAGNVYLVFTPNVADTQQSLVNTASALQNIYTLQNSVLANSFSYDCNEFGKNGVCISVGGRNTAVSTANGMNNTSGLLIAAYRPHQNYRIGAYVDQNLSVNNAGSTVNLGNNTPVIGLFGAWNERIDGTGTEVKVSVAYGQKNATVTRQVVGTSEAGSGSSQLNSQGAQVTARYGFGVIENVIVAPYVGIRYTQNNMGGYTEGTSATVTTPLTYSALNTNATTALAGLGVSYRFIPRAGIFGSVGVETDTNTANGAYSATGLSGLTPINFNANSVKTRPTAMLGAYYDVSKNQRLGVTGIYRQESFQAVSTTTVMATYTLGL